MFGPKVSNHFPQNLRVSSCISIKYTGLITFWVLVNYIKPKKLVCLLLSKSTLLGMINLKISLSTHLHVSVIQHHLPLYIARPRSFCKCTNLALFITSQQLKSLKQTRSLWCQLSDTSTLLLDQNMIHIYLFSMWTTI